MLNTSKELTSLCFVLVEQGDQSDGHHLSDYVVKMSDSSAEGTVSLAQWLRCPPRERKIPSSNLACAKIFPGSSHTSDLEIGTPVATLPDTWRYRVSAGTAWPGVSILWLGEMESLVCNFYLSVTACKIVWADPSLRYTHMLLGR